MADHPSNIEDLRERFRAGWRPEFLFFWSHTRTGEPGGIGLAEAEEHARNPPAWRGRNLLGFALMTARDRLTGATSPEATGIPTRTSR